MPRVANEIRHLRWHTAWGMHVHTTTRLPGDDLVPGATVAMDRAGVVDHAAVQVWPWIAQLGKGRAGWYMAGSAERFLVPVRSWRGARAVLPQFQDLRVGQRVPDYGRDEEFEVAIVEPPRILVYRSLRGWPHGRAWPAPGERLPAKTLAISWAIVLDELAPDKTRIHFRLRARRGQSAKASRAFTVVGDQFDRATIALMLSGVIRFRESLPWRPRTPRR